MSDENTIPEAPSDHSLGQLLKQARTIALVGASPKANRPSHMVMAYLQRAGYHVLPVNPGQEGKNILGERVYGSLSDITEPVDIVDIFRRPAQIPPIIEQAMAIDAKTIWMQLGIVNQEAARRAMEAGMNVVMNRCTKIEHARLLG
jgi:predicted CoA-binding protein